MNISDEQWNDLLGQLGGRAASVAAWAKAQGLTGEPEKKPRKKRKAKETYKPEANVAVEGADAEEDDAT